MLVTVAVPIVMMVSRTARSVLVSVVILAAIGATPCMLGSFVVRAAAAAAITVMTLAVMIARQSGRSPNGERDGYGREKCRLAHIVDPSSLRRLVPA